MINLNDFDELKRENLAFYSIDTIFYFCYHSQKRETCLKMMKVKLQCGARMKLNVATNR